jgi:Leucine-rich repeat (LRR) protein
MKIKLLTLTLALLSFVSYTQTTSIPDSNFEQALITLGIDSDATVNGQVLTADISGVTSLNISNKIIADLTGIEDFTSLQTFNCSFNSFSTLMLPSGNNLLELVCQGPNITNIDAISTHTALTKIDIKYGNVTSLNVDAHVNLEYLDIYDNSIGTLNLLNNSALTFLDCYRNGLTNLDLSGNPLLGYLNCTDNNLSTLNLTNNTALENLVINLCVNLTSITLPTTTTLHYIDAVNCDSLTALDVSNNPNLSWLDIHSSGLQNTLDLSSNNELFYLDCSNNDLTGLTLPNSPFLSEIYCNNNMIPSLNLGGCTGLTRLECHYNDLINLDVSSNSMLQVLYCNNNFDTLTSISFNNPVLWEVYCYNNPMLTTLNNTLSLSGLIDFGLWNCDLTTLDLTNSTVLQYVEPGNNPNLNSLTLPNTTTLTQVWAYSADLSTLDYTNNTGLEYLDIGINNFTSADVSMLPNLLEFYCNENQLTSLNIKNGFNGILDWMWADDNSSLTCIQVDDKTDAESRDPIDHWRKDITASYEESCALSSEEFDLSAISVYPNPVKDKVYIELHLQANYSLTNMFGQEIKKGTFVTGNNVLDIHDLANGLYLLNLETTDGKATKKVIKE